MASLGVAGALLVGCGVSASTLQYYSRRYVGELALVTGRPPGACLRISVLDFWGNREVRPILQPEPGGMRVTTRIGGEERQGWWARPT